MCMVSPSPLILSDAFPRLLFAPFTLLCISSRCLLVSSLAFTAPFPLFVGAPLDSRPPPFVTG